MPYLAQITINWLVLLLALIYSCQAMPAHAGEWYMTGSLGATVFTCTICQDDGTWVQTGLPNQQNMTHLAWRAGAGYRVNEAWSIQAHYLNFGVAKIRAQVVEDADYNPKTHQCLANCSSTIAFNTHDLMEGGEISISRHFPIWGVEPFLRIGGASMYHRLVVQFNGVSIQGQDGKPFRGWVPMVLVGGGICTQGSIQACGETTYYKGFGGGTDWSAGLPISKESVMILFTIKFPLP